MSYLNRHRQAILLPVIALACVLAFPAAASASHEWSPPEGSAPDPGAGPGEPPGGEIPDGGDDWGDDGGGDGNPVDAPTDPAAPITPPSKGQIQLQVLPNGDAKAPKRTSKLVRRMVAAANRINETRYRFGAAHGSRFFDPNPKAFDCSSAVSYVLYAGGLVSGPLDSRGFFHWGKAGKGKRLTVYTRRDHAFMVIGNLRFDTGRATPVFGKQDSGPRWGLPRPADRFKTRHFPGL